MIFIIDGCAYDTFVSWSPSFHLYVNSGNWSQVARLVWQILLLDCKSISPGQDRLCFLLSSSLFIGWLVDCFGDWEAGAV